MHRAIEKQLADRAMAFGRVGEGIARAFADSAVKINRDHKPQGVELIDML